MPFFICTKYLRRPYELFLRFFNYRPDQCSCSLFIQPAIYLALPIDSTLPPCLPLKTPHITSMPSTKNAPHYLHAFHQKRSTSPPCLPLKTPHVTSMPSTKNSPRYLHAFHQKRFRRTCSNTTLPLRGVYYELNRCRLINWH